MTAAAGDAARARRRRRRRPGHRRAAGRSPRRALHPRLARALLDGAPAVGADRAAEVVALLDADRPTDDLVAAWRRHAPARRRLAARRSAGSPRRSPAVHGGAGGRRAAGRPGGRAGRRAGLPGAAGPGPASRAARVPDGRRDRRGAGARVGAGRGALARGRGRGPRHPGARTRPGALRPCRSTRRPPGRPARHCCARQRGGRPGSDGDVVARRRERLGAITLVERPLRGPRPDVLRPRCSTGCAGRGWACCAGPAAAVALRERLAFCHAALGDPWPDVADDGAARRGADDWLGPELAGPAAAPTWNASTSPPRCAGCCPGRWRAGWTRSRRSGSPAPERVAGPGGLRRPGGAGAGGEGAGGVRLAGRRRTLAAACPSCCTCSPPPGGRWR